MVARSFLVVAVGLGFAGLAGCGKAEVSSTKPIPPPGASGGAGGGSAGSGGGPGTGIDFAVPSPQDAGAGSAPPVTPPAGETCARDTQTAKLTPVDLLLLLDASGSMSERAGARSRWEMARDALVMFLKDGRSAGLGVGLQLFPIHRTCNDDGTCFLPSPGGCRTLSACLAPNAPLSSGVPCGGANDDPCAPGTTCTPLGRCSLTGGDCLTMGQPCPSGMPGDMCGPRQRQCRLGPPVRGSCTVADYQNVLVPIAELPAAGARLSGAIDTKLPLGGTPMSPAVQGALAYLGQRAQAMPTRRAALVLVSDGAPEGCGDAASIAATIQAAAQRTPPLNTYVVGVFGDTDPGMGPAVVAQLATAGGTNTPFIVSANEQLSERFLAALNQIRGAALSCELVIPAPSTGQIDYGKVNVKVSGAGGAQDLTYVERRERCDAAPNGWYYDTPPATGTPSRVLLCPAACDRLKADPQASIEVVFGCRSRTID